MSTDTIPGRLARRAHERPDAVAIAQVGGEAMTFRQWEERSNALARGLHARGVGPGDRVVVCGDREHWTELAIAYVAVHKAGAVALPLTPQAGSDQLAWAVGQAGAVGIVGPVRPSGCAGVWVAASTDLRHGRSSDPVAAPIDSGCAAEILYTSGTTGRPKGVIASHGNVLAPQNRPPRPGVEPQLVLHAFPPATTGGQSLLVLPLHPEPHSVLGLASSDPRALLDAVRDHRPTQLLLVPAAAIALTRLADVEPAQLDSVRLVRSMGAPVAPATLDRLTGLFPSARVVNLYSTTECWPAHTSLQHDPAHRGSVGRPSRGAGVRVVGGHGRPLAAGEQGEVQLQVRGVARRAYLGDPEATAQVFQDEGWVRTGDTGYLDEDGYLYLVERNADLVIVGGRNVSAVAIEAVLQECDEVVDAAVVGVPHPLLGEVVVAAVEADGPVGCDELLRLVGDRLGSSQTPSQIVVLDALPRNALGKVVKRKLRERLAGAAPEAGRTPPQSELERSVAAIWCRALAIDEVALEDNFLALGGTSLAVTDITAEVRDALGVEVPLRALFRARDLAEYVRTVEWASPASPPAADDLAIPPVPRDFR